MDQVFEYSAEADLENLKDVRTFIQKTGTNLGADKDTVGDLCLVVDEAVTNIVLHGYAGQPGSVDLRMYRDGDKLVITIRDQAKSFHAQTVENPHLDEPLAEREFGGMGVYLIRKFTDESEFRVLPDGGNELYLLKSGVF